MYAEFVNKFIKEASESSIRVANYQIDENITAQFFLGSQCEDLRINMLCKGWWKGATVCDVKIDLDRFCGNSKPTISLDDISSSSGGTDTDEISCQLQAFEIKAEAIKQSVKIAREILSNAESLSVLLQEIFANLDRKQQEASEKRRVEREKFQQEADEAFKKFESENTLLTEKTAKSLVNKLAKEIKEQKEIDWCGNRTRKVVLETFAKSQNKLHKTALMVKYCRGRVSFHWVSVDGKRDYLDNGNQIPRANIANELKNFRVVSSEVQQD